MVKPRAPRNARGFTYTGKAAATRHARGFTYIGLLLAVAIMGAGLATVGHVWHTAVQRANERELEFIGEQFKQAIERYYESSPGPLKLLPATLEELVSDARHPGVVRHLRKLYVDPITGRGEWGLVKQDERIVGVHSLSERTAFRTRGISGPEAKPVSYSEWKFVAELARPLTADQMLTAP